MDQLAQKELEDYRYQQLQDAFYELVAKQVSEECLATLRFETGFFKEDLNKIKEELK